MGRFINYVKDTKGELSHVTWPSRKQAVVWSLVVVAVSVFAAAYLGFFDYLFTLILEKFVL